MKKQEIEKLQQLEQLYNECYHRAKEDYNKGYCEKTDKDYYLTRWTGVYDTMLLLKIKPCKSLNLNGLILEELQKMINKLLYK